MKDKIKIAGTVGLVYCLCTALVMIVLLLAVLTASFVAWSTNLFNPDVLMSMFRISIILGLALGTWAMYKDWDGLMETVNEDED